MLLPHLSSLPSPPPPPLPHPQPSCSETAAIRIPFPAALLRLLRQELRARRDVQNAHAGARGKRLADGFRSLQEILPAAYALRVGCEGRDSVGEGGTGGRGRERSVSMGGWAGEGRVLWRGRCCVAGEHDGAGTLSLHSGDFIELDAPTFWSGFQLWHPFSRLPRVWHPQPTSIDHTESTHSIFPIFHKPSTASLARRAIPIAPSNPSYSPIPIHYVRTPWTPSLRPPPCIPYRVMSQTFLDHLQDLKIQQPAISPNCLIPSQHPFPYHLPLW